MNKFPILKPAFFLLILITNIPVFGQSIKIIGESVPTRNILLDKQFKNYEVFSIPSINLKEVQNNQENLQIQLNLGDHNWPLNLAPSEILGANYREIVGTKTGPVVLPPRKNIAYTGYLNSGGHEVRLTLTDDWLMGFITNYDGEKQFIEPLSNLLDDAPSDHFVLYGDDDIIPHTAGSCGALEAHNRHVDPSIMLPPNIDNSGTLSMSCLEVDLSVASTFDMINNNHNSPQLVMNHIIAITNMMQTYFEFFPIQYKINDNYVSASVSADPFYGEATATDANVLLPGFQNWAQNEGIFGAHDVGQFWTARNIEGCGNGIGLVGCAYIGTICNPARYNICEDYVPQSIKTLSVLSAHELGHNWNCLHSDLGDAPFNIMNGGIQSNAIGFGPNSQAKITNYANAATCLASCGNNPTPVDCPARADRPYEQWIEDVIVGELENVGSGKFRDFSTAGYSDYTDLAAPDLERGQTVNYDFNAGFSGVPVEFYWTAFIDFNQNGAFDLPEEEVVRQESTGIAGDFSIPSDASPGNTLMRIIVATDDFSGPCDNPARGEVEDYIVNITGDIITDLADLTLSNLVLSSTTASTDMLVDFTVDLTNQGLATTGSFKVGVFLSFDGELSADDLKVGEIPTGNFTPGLTINAVAGAFDLTNVTPDDYILILKIDSEDQEIESDESNNILTSSFTVTGNTFPQWADLALTMTSTATAPDAFEHVTITLTLTNEGPEGATDNVINISQTDDFVIAGNGSPIASPGTSFSAFSRNWTVPFLTNGASATLTVELFTLTENFNPCAQVSQAGQDDPDSTPNNGNCPQTNEDDEANLNEVTPPVETIDLVLESLEAATEATSGIDLTVTSYISRTGNSTTYNNASLNLYLSLDDQWSPNDDLLGTTSIGSNQNFNNSTRDIITNFIGIIPGNYYLIAIIDQPNEVEETNENNNLLTKTITIIPEEIPECSTIIGGDEILCSENIGNITRLYIRDADQVVQYELSADATIVSSGDVGPLVYDSTFIKNEILTHKLADGSIFYQNNLSPEALDVIPEPTAAARLSDGTYLIGGFVALGEVGQEPYSTTLRVAKLNSDLTLIDSSTIFINNTYPANLNDKIFAIFPLENGEASVLHTVYNVGIINFSNLALAKVTSDLTISLNQVYPQTFFGSVTETPCGDLLIKANRLSVSQKSNGRAARRIRISKDGTTVNSDFNKGSQFTDRTFPIEFASFQLNDDPSLHLSYTTMLDNPPATLIGLLPGETGDTTEVIFDYFNYYYGTRNENTAILYGNLNGQITAVIPCLEPPVEDGVDIAVNLTVNDSLPGLYANIVYTLTVLNQGDEDATGVKIDFDYGAQVQPKKLAFVSNSDPTYSPWQGIWNVGDLPAGSAKSFNLELFVLPAAAPNTTLTATLSQLDQPDVNATNDEDPATIYVDGASTHGGGNAEINTSSYHVNEMAIRQVYPNPAQQAITVSIESKEPIENSVMQIYNAYGQLMFYQTINLAAGMNHVRADISQLIDGIYLVVLPGGQQRNLVKRFVKTE